jgi:uncharacterized protein YecT (DUF1311 family)
MNAAGAPCRQAGTTAETAQCFSLAARQADDDLNRTYEQIRRALRPEDQAKLQASERLWISYRDAACTAERDLYTDGTGANPAHLACLEAETRQHLTALSQRYGWRLEKFSK